MLSFFISVHRLFSFLLEIFDFSPLVSFFSHSTQNALNSMVRQSSPKQTESVSNNKIKSLKIEVLMTSFRCVVFETLFLLVLVTKTTKCFLVLIPVRVSSHKETVICLAMKCNQNSSHIKNFIYDDFIYFSFKPNQFLLRAMVAISGYFPTICRYVLFLWN